MFDRDKNKEERLRLLRELRDIGNQLLDEVRGLRSDLRQLIGASGGKMQLNWGQPFNTKEQS